MPSNPSIHEVEAEVALRVLELSGQVSSLKEQAYWCRGNREAYAVIGASLVRKEAELAVLQKFLRTKNPSDLPGDFSVRPASRIEGQARLKDRNWEWP